MKKLIIFFLFFAAFIANAQESFFRGNNNYVGPVILVPNLSATSAASSITLTSASSGGSISDNGGAPITASGICWSSTSSTPTLSDSKTTDGPLSVGTFSSSLASLTAGVTYNVRAYATNSKGTGYGPVMTFTTLANPPFQAPAIVQAGLILNLDAANPLSYPGTGSTWTNLVTGNAVPSFSLSSGSYVNSDGGVIRFPSTGGFAESTSGFANLTKFTVEIWVNTESISTSPSVKVITSKWSTDPKSMYIGFFPNGFLSHYRTLANNTHYNATFAINESDFVNKWNQVVGITLGSTLQIWNNGILKGSTSWPGVVSVPNTPLIIGGLGGPQPFLGKIASEKIYNRALSAQEVLQNYNAQKARFGIS